MDLGEAIELANGEGEYTLAGVTFEAWAPSGKRRLYAYRDGVKLAWRDEATGEITVTSGLRLEDVVAIFRAWDRQGARLAGARRRAGVHSRD